MNADRLGSLGKYYPYGTDKGSGNPANGSEKFTGYERDGETGNDYAVNRYMQPGTGRFLTPDPVGAHRNDPGTWNKYAYVGGDPVNRTDPNGHDFVCSGPSDDQSCSWEDDPPDPSAAEVCFWSNVFPELAANNPVGAAMMCGGSGTDLGSGGSANEPPPLNCQQQLVDDVITDRAAQISGDLANILAQFTPSATLTTVAGQPTSTGGIPLETELVMTADTPDAFTSLTNFLAAPGGPFSPASFPHDGYSGNYRQNVFLYSMQIETNPSTSAAPYGQITIDIDPVNPNAPGLSRLLGLIGHGGQWLLHHYLAPSDTNYSTLASKWGFGVPNCP